MWDDVIVGGVNWSMNVDVVNTLGENAAAMNGYYGVFPSLWWNDNDVPGVQQVIAAFEAGGYPDSDKSVSYILSFGGMYAWAEIVEAAIDDVGFENLDGAAFFEAFQDMGTVSALGLFTYDVRGETRAPRTAQIRQAVFDGTSVEFVVVQDFTELPDMRPPAE
jgi:branched-chain amino acid transport system substrate-binding protein